MENKPRWGVDHGADREMSTADATVSRRQRCPKLGQTLSFAADYRAMKSSLDGGGDGVIGVLWEALCLENEFFVSLPLSLRAAPLTTGGLHLKPRNTSSSQPFLNENS